MDNKEFALWSMALRTYYPKADLLNSKEAMQLWYKQLEDLPYNVAETALNKWVAQNKWHPTIADIRETASDIMLGALPDWGAAWQEVISAMGCCGHNYPQEALASMGELTRETVRRLGWNQLCMSENPAASRANFRDIYNELAEKKKRERQLPEKLMLTIQNIKMLGSGNNET